MADKNNFYNNCIKFQNNLFIIFIKSVKAFKIGFRKLHKAHLLCFGSLNFSNSIILLYNYATEGFLLKFQGKSLQLKSGQKCECSFSFILALDDIKGFMIVKYFGFKKFWKYNTKADLAYFMPFVCRIILH